MNNILLHYHNQIKNMYRAIKTEEIAETREPNLHRQSYFSSGLKPIILVLITSLSLTVLQKSPIFKSFESAFFFKSSNLSQMVAVPFLVGSFSVFLAIIQHLSLSLHFSINSVSAPL